MIRRLQKRYALSEQGAKDLIKGCFACVLQNISFMFPVGLLYCMVSDLMNGGVPESRLPFYIVGCILCVGLILLTTYFQYNATYFATYTESGVRRITLAERLRKIPLSFFGKKDLADLTSTIMADCTFLEQSFFPLYPGACRIHHLYGLDCRQPVLLRLAYGAGGSLGDAGGVCHCRFFCKGTGRV